MSTENNDLQTIILIARSGGGKGTQAEKLIEYLRAKDSREVFHMQSGERIRDFLQESSYAAKLGRELSPKGELQPAFLSTWSWAGEIIKKLDKDEHLIVDGAPRRINEALLVTEALRFFKRENPQVVYINVSEDWSKKRILGRDSDRKDDKDPDYIERRQDWFETDVIPVIEHLKEDDYYTVHEVNGEQSIEEVHQDILKVLKI